MKSGCGQRRTAHAAGQEEKRQVSCAKHLKFGYPSGNLYSFLVRHSAQVFSEGTNRACCFLETFVFMLPDKNLNPVKWQRTTYCYLNLSSNFQPTIALKSNRSFQLQRDWASNQHFQWSFKISFHPSKQAKYVAQKLDVHFLIVSLWSRFGNTGFQKTTGVKGVMVRRRSVNWFLGARMTKMWRLQRLYTLNRYEPYDMWIRSHKLLLVKKKKNYEAKLI